MIRFYRYRHCHIAWHAAGGLSVTFLERAEDLRATVKQSDLDTLNEQCEEWREYYADSPYKQYDSGI